MWNLISGLKTLRENSVQIFLLAIWSLDVLKRIVKIFPKRLLNKEIKKAGLKFNPGLGLIGLWTTGPSALEKRHVVEPIDCSFACLRNAFCVSLNVAAVADGKGKYWCELLSSNMHSDAAKLAANYQSHHYSLSQVFEKWLDLWISLFSSTETKIIKKPEVFCC